ncbi:SGNH/GDSL hydrolase family protein [Enterococcus crotali]|uniref:SGNH/GDSL hydrolase family protein n=1 Tax=Enterococcus crotali TaxID=1453587 RepID=UPI00046EB8BB|nr:SGNH/GDSL hydrolase family protein [Enterococcus crotali]
MKKAIYLLVGALIPIILFSMYYFFSPKSPEVNETKTEETLSSSSLSKKVDKLTYSPMGDSISAGLIVKNEEQRFTNILANLIEESYDVQVEQKGVFNPGARASDLGISSIEDIKEQKPNIVTIEYGTNDLLDYKNENSLKQFEVNLSYIISELQEQNILIVLVTTWNRDQNISQLYDDIIFKVASKYDIPVANIRSLWTNTKDTIEPKSADNFLKNKNIKDDMHPNEKGHEEIARRIFQSIEPRLSNYIDLLK